MPIQSLESLVDNLDQLPDLFTELKSHNASKSSAGRFIAFLYTVQQSYMLI